MKDDDMRGPEPASLSDGALDALVARFGSGYHEPPATAPDGILERVHERGAFGMRRTLHMARVAWGTLAAAVIVATVVGVHVISDARSTGGTLDARVARIERTLDAAEEDTRTALAASPQDSYYREHIATIEGQRRELKRRIAMIESSR